MTMVKVKVVATAEMMNRRLINSASPSCDELPCLGDDHAVNNIRVTKVRPFQRLIHALQDLRRISQVVPVLKT